jgi:hypothetical protein
MLTSFPLLSAPVQEEVGPPCFRLPADVDEVGRGRCLVCVVNGVGNGSDSAAGGQARHNALSRYVRGALLDLYGGATCDKRHNSSIYYILSSSSVS